MTTERDPRIEDAMLKKALADQFKVREDEVEIVDWTSGAGSGAADNFACDMVAVRGKAKIKGSLQDFSYMTKLPPAIKAKAEMFRSLGIIEKEYLLYGVVLPKIKKAREEHNLKPMKVPKCYYADLDPGNFVMENLKDNQFQLIKSKDNGMDEGEVKAFIEALAEFHASMYFLMVQHPGGKAGFLNEHEGLKGVKQFDEATEAMMRRSADQTLDTIEAIVRDFMGNQTADKIAKFRPHAYKKWADGLCKPWGDFRTIVHGDSWFNNAMFRYDSNGNTIDLALLDFQVCRVSSPVMDIGYALTTGTRGDVRMKELPRWLKLYYDKFSNEMKVFGFNAKEVYPFEKMQQEYDDAYHYSFTWAVQHTNILLKKDESFDVADLKDMFNEEESKAAFEKIKNASRNQAKTNDAYRERVLTLVQEAESRGFLDQF